MCVPFPAADGLGPLRELLTRLEPPDCDCPPLLSCPCGQDCPPAKRDDCPHCREACGCAPAPFQPPCRHLLAPLDPADLLDLQLWHGRLFPGARAGHFDDLRADLCRAAWPEEYLDPPNPIPEPLARTPGERVQVMAERAGACPAERPLLALRHPLDRWGRLARETQDA